MQNIMTIDVEEYFHPTELCSTVTRGDWDSLPSRIEAQMETVLGLLAARRVPATFFVLGWIAEKFPRLVRNVAAMGHEIACHSYAHRLVYDLTPDEFRRDLRRAVAAIEDACGVTPKAYRAPSYSITERSLWALEILVENGFTHDSSIYPIRHDRYGIPGFSRHAQTMRTPSGLIREVPIATVLLPSGRVAPVGGGGYLRLLPYRYTAAGIRRVNATEGQPACVYFHPWEIDTGQPRLAPGLIGRLRTYTGLSSMKSKIERLLADFEFTSLETFEPSPCKVLSLDAVKRDTRWRARGHKPLTGSGREPAPVLPAAFAKEDLT